MTTVLALVQEFCGKKTLPVPTAVVGSTDTGIVQIRYLLAETVRELSEFRWQQQKVQKNWTALGAEDQGLLTTIFGADFRQVCPGTMWDLTLDQEIKGPATDKEWSDLKAEGVTGTEYFYKFIADHLRIYPAPTVGDSMFVMYESSYGVASVALDPKAAITADDDVFLVPDILVHRSLDYRWKRQKGEPWEADYNEFRDLLAKMLVRGGLPVLSMDSDAPAGVQPGIVIPSGNW